MLRMMSRTELPCTIARARRTLRILPQWLIPCSAMTSQPVTTVSRATNDERLMEVNPPCSPVSDET